jgi:hypothetical protein
LVRTFINRSEEMEVIVAIGVLVLLALLAVRFGHDSRELPRSREHELASLGMTWAEVVPAPAPSPLVTDGGTTSVLQDERPLIVPSRHVSGQVVVTTLPAGGTELSVVG